LPGCVDACRAATISATTWTATNAETQAADEVPLGADENQMLARLEAGVAVNERSPPLPSHELRKPLADVKTELE